MALPQPAQPQAGQAVRPLVVGIGGSTRPGSSTERVLRAVTDALAGYGFDVRIYCNEALMLPAYCPGAPLAAGAIDLVEAVRAADAVVLGSPGYHGGMSGLVKNAVDYLEELRGDVRPYLHGRPVVCVTTAEGWQAAVNTLSALRQVVHALRGWPTPLGLALNTADRARVPDSSDTLLDPATCDAVRTAALQVYEFLSAQGRQPPAVEAIRASG